VSNQDNRPLATDLAILNGLLGEGAPRHMTVDGRADARVGNIVLATGVAWARVEAGAHYPSDVLAGAALGHFLSAFIYDGFMGLPEHKRWGLYVSPTKGGAMIGLSFGF
jgi:membrane-associated phospholipid phosphatase